MKVTTIDSGSANVKFSRGCGENDIRKLSRSHGSWGKGCSGLKSSVLADMCDSDTFGFITASRWRGQLRPCAHSPSRLPSSSAVPQRNHRKIFTRCKWLAIRVLESVKDLCLDAADTFKEIWYRDVIFQMCTRDLE